MENKFYIIQKSKHFDWSWFVWEGPSILCENGQFHTISEIMGLEIYTPVLFISKESAEEARKMFGRWPRYKVVKITDPSWLN